MRFSRSGFFWLSRCPSHTWAHIKYPSSLCLCTRVYKHTHAHHPNTRKNSKVYKTKPLSLPLPKHSLPRQQQVRVAACVAVCCGVLRWVAVCCSICRATWARLVLAAIVQCHQRGQLRNLLLHGFYVYGSCRLASSIGRGASIRRYVPYTSRGL